MPTKLNNAGQEQAYIPKGNGDASGEYTNKKSEETPDDIIKKLGGKTKVQQFNERLDETFAKTTKEQITPNEKFKEEYNFYSDFQNGTANKDNFFINSVAEFEQVKRRPTRKPDYVSYNRNGEISSEYWYNGDTLIRGSNHWGNGVSTCDWKLNTSDLKVEGLNFTSKVYGKVKFDDIKFKTTIIKDENGKKHIVGFNNVVEYNKNPLLGKVFKLDNGDYYMWQGATTYYEYVKADKKSDDFYEPNFEALEKIRKQKENELTPEQKQKQQHDELMNTNDYLDINSNSFKVGDTFLTHRNEAFKIIDIAQENNGTMLTLANGKKYFKRNIS